MPDHFDALRNENAMLRAKLFSYAGAPWEGDSLSLKYTMLQVVRNWPMSIDVVAPAQPAVCPVQFTEEESRQCVESHQRGRGKLEELSEIRSFIGTDSLGWVPDDEHLEKSRSTVKAIKEGSLLHCQTETEREALSEHFPFDGHNEDI